MSFKICIPIPVYSADLEELKKKITDCYETKPDLIEFRFDYISDVEKITLDFVRSLRHQVNAIPVIFTLRNQEEGGKIPLDEETRLLVLKTLIQAKPDYIDIELSSKGEFIENIINFINEYDVGLILSFHNLDETPSYLECLKIIENEISRLEHSYLKNDISLKRVIYKFVFTAQVLDDNITTLKLCKTLKNKGKDFICFCMGDLGIISRIFCVKLGSFLTFGAFGEQTASGQIKIKTIRKIHQLLIDD